RTTHLLSLDSPPQTGGSNVRISRLLLGMDSNVIAIYIRRRLFLDRRVEMKPDAPLQFFLEGLDAPAMFQEQKLQPGPFPVFAQLLALAENFGDSLENRNHLVPLHKSIEPDRQMWIGRKAAADSQRKTNFGISATNCREAHVVDFGIGAPDVASGDADFELARQVVEVAVADEEAVGFERQGRSVVNFVGIHASEGATGDVAGIVSARAHRGQTCAPQSVE